MIPTEKRAAVISDPMAADFNPPSASMNPGAFVTRVNSIARASTEPRDWIFTFGQGHRAYAATRGLIEAVEDEGSGKLRLPQKGFRLANRYVVIHGTFDTARARMNEIFGPVWCAQYGSPEAAGVAEYDLTELVITDD